MKSRWPIRWEVYVVVPEDAAGWKHYKRFVEYLNRAGLKGRSGPGFIVVTNLRTPEEADHLKVLAEGYNLEVPQILEREQVPEPADGEG